MTEEQIADFLKENIDYFVTNDIIITVFRTIGWAIVKLFNSILDFCALLYDKTFGLVDITEWSVVNDFVEEYDPLIKGILILSLVVLGYIYIIGKNKQNDLLISILIFVVVVTSSNYLFSTFNSFAVMFKDAVVGEDGVVDGYVLVNQNLYDLVYIDEQIGLDEMDGSRELPQYPELTENDMRLIDITEVLKDDKEGLTDSAKDILGKRFDYSYSTEKVVDVYNGLLWTDFLSEYYYRYQFNYGTYYLSALAAIIVFLGVSYKNMKIMWELLNSRILATLFSADISSKKKIVKILEGIRDGYYALCFTAITLRCFFIVSDYITDQVRVNGTARGVITLFAAFCVIDGANIMERITGVDAGLSSLTGKLLAGMHMVQGAVMTAQHMRQMAYMKRQTRAMESIKNDKAENSGDAINGGNTVNDGNLLEAGNIGGNGNDMDNMDPAGYGRGDTGGKNSTAEENGHMDKNQSETDRNQSESQDHTDSGSSAENRMEEMTDTTSDSKSFEGNTETAEDNFRAMDNEINSGQMDDRHAQSGSSDPDTKYSGHGDEKGMFERWADNSSSSGPRQEEKGNMEDRNPKGIGNMSEENNRSAESVQSRSDAGTKGEKNSQDSGNMFDRDRTSSGPAQPGSDAGAKGEGAARDNGKMFDHDRKSAGSAQSQPGSGGSVESRGSTQGKGGSVPGHTRNAPGSTQPRSDGNSKKGKESMFDRDRNKGKR